jgi:hypothetical protein
MLIPEGAGWIKILSDELSATCLSISRRFLTLRLLHALVRVMWSHATRKKAGSIEYFPFDLTMAAMLWLEFQLVLLRMQPLQ